VRSAVRSGGAATIRGVSAAASTSELARLADELCDEVLAAHRAAQSAALASGSTRALARSVGQGVGDETFAIDAACEAAVDRWFERHARRGPLSVLTEDRGWRHLGPAAHGVRTLEGFDHGGPRIAIDPVDGTRNVMADLRSAWTVVSACGAGAGEPHAADVAHGTLGELPTSNAARARRLWADAGGGAWRNEFEYTTSARTAARALRVDALVEIEGYLPFFRYDLASRRDATQLETRFLERLVAHEGANARRLFDDQYICSAGQLVLLALGTYRMVCDPRELLARRRGAAATTSKPYDLAGALVVAREAGCLLVPLDDTLHVDAGGEPQPFDFQVDAATPVGFVGFHNAATARRLLPHLVAVLAEPLRPS
jgi:fructose-1,6-bisphosphatase/inositol monophosphatase family enzyme